MSRSCATPALIAAALLVVCLPGCGNLITVHDAGQVAITVDDGGRPVIAVMTCAKATPVVSLSEGRRPTDPDTRPNVQRGSWQARRSFAGVETIALTGANPDWVTSREPGPLESDRLFVVDGGTAEDEDASLRPVSFRVPDLAALSPDQVLVDGKVQTLSTFAAYRCS